MLAICQILWPKKHPKDKEQHPWFPSLKYLRFVICSTLDKISAYRPKLCQFPQLERMIYSIKPIKAGNNSRGTLRPLDMAARQWLVERLLMHRISYMKYLEIDCVNEAAICNYCDSLPALEHLYLVQFNHVFYESNSEVHDPSLSHILNSALVIGSLRSYISWSSFLASCRPLELTFINHQLRTLNISTWAIGFCGLLLLLSRLPAPEEIRVILADPQIYPASEDISCNLSIKRMCLDTNLGKINPWVHSSYESLISIFKHILSLKELLLFSKTHQWLEGAILQQTDKELLRLIQTVTVGQCNRDEKRTYIQSLVCIL